MMHCEAMTSSSGCHDELVSSLELEAPINPFSLKLLCHSCGEEIHRAPQAARVVGKIMEKVF